MKTISIILTVFLVISSFAHWVKSKEANESSAWFSAICGWICVLLYLIR